MREEVDMIESNSQIVSKQGKPDVPYYAFISTDIEEEWWKESIIYYIKAIDGDYSILDGHHYIHLDYPELIAEKSRKLIEKTIEN